MRKVQVHPADKLASALLNILYPTECPSCGNKCDTHITAPLCSSCWSVIERYTGPSCERCSLPLTSQYSTLCGDCLTSPPDYSLALSYGIYEGPLMEAVHWLKFHGARRLWRPLSALLSEMPFPKADLMTAVPLSPRGLRAREFNHSLLIARGLSASNGIPLQTGLLVKTRETARQLGLTRAQRKKNLRGAFSATQRLDGRKVILVDDVMTTGATANECSKALLKAGASEVVAVTVARARRF